MMGKSRILVVDDNEEFCRNVADILEMRDCDVMSAYTGLKALELVKQNGYDLVLMDIKMPVMDGVETFKKIKKMAPRIPVIMVTAYALEELVREALREGAYGFLKKPLDFDLLLILIDKAIDKGALILVADDDENLCANIKEVLSEQGYQVCTAYDGNKAVEKARRNNFDIILLDMKMPVLNGLETYLNIRDFRPNVVAVIITGYRQETNELVQRALQKNAYTCLEKPIDMNELISLMEQIINEHNAQGILTKN